MFETSPIEIAINQAILTSFIVTLVSLVIFTVCLVFFTRFKQKSQKIASLILIIISLAGVSCGIPLLFLTEVTPLSSDDKPNITAYQNALKTSILPDMKMAMTLSLSMFEPDIKKAEKLTKNALKLAKTPELKSEICRSFGVHASNMHYKSLAFKYFEQGYEYQKPSRYEWTVAALIYWRNGKQAEAEKIYRALESNGFEVKRPY